MATYLYTWNPKKWPWVDLALAESEVKTGQYYDLFWSCGHTKKIQIGDQFLLMRLGEDPKGIIAAGYVTSTPFERAHWDPDKSDKTALRTDLLFKALSQKPIVPLETLEVEYPDFRWTPESGGITVPDPIGEALFLRIQQGTANGFTPVSHPEIMKYVEGKPKTVTIKTYDRNPWARQRCIEYHGLDCKVCGFNFGKAYGAAGEGYIEVHHVKPISEYGEEHEIDPVKDLMPVCANCHRMLHKGQSAMALPKQIVSDRVMMGRNE